MVRIQFNKTFILDSDFYLIVHLFSLKNSDYFYDGLYKMLYKLTTKKEINLIILKKYLGICRPRFPQYVIINIFNLN